MRKKGYPAFLLCLALSLILASMSREVRAARRPVAYIGGGPTILAGPESFRNNHKTGFNIVAGILYPASSHIHLTGRLEYHLVNVDFHRYFNARLDLSGGGIDILLIGLDLKVNTRRSGVSLRPYFLAGGGWSRLSQLSFTSELAFEQYAPLLIENQTRPYYNIGAGADIKPSASLTFFLLIRYLEIKQDKDNFKLLPVTLGIRF